MMTMSPQALKVEQDHAYKLYNVYLMTYLGQDPPEARTFGAAPEEQLAYSLACCWGRIDARQDSIAVGRAETATAGPGSDNRTDEANTAMEALDDIGPRQLKDVLKLINEGLDRKPSEDEDDE